VVQAEVSRSQLLQHILFVHLYQISLAQVSRCLPHVGNQVKSHFCFLGAVTSSWFAPRGAELQKNGACICFLGARLKSHFCTRKTELQSKSAHTNICVASREHSQAVGPRSQTCPKSNLKKSFSFSDDIVCSYFLSWLLTLGANSKAIS
jgi:hypothetical protein